MSIKTAHNTHILKRLKGNIKIHELKSFDTETYSDYNKFLMGGIYDKEYGYQSYKDKQEMIDALLNNDNINKLLFATNLEFDFNVLFSDHELWTKFQLIKNSSGLVECIYTFPKGHHEEGKQIRFLDTGNFAKFSVAEMGKILGIKKLSQDVKDLLGKRLKTQEQWERMIRYNQEDCRITHDFIDLLQQGFNALGCEMKTTISSTAMGLFRRQFMKHNIAHEDFVLKKDYRQNIFESYTGGRVEAFSRGMIKNKYMFDINSLYPYVMTFDYPLPETAHHLRQPKKLFIEYEGVSCVDIICPPMHIPLLPYRTDKLLFPTGIFKQKTYTHMELRKALELGYNIKKIHWTIYYGKTEPIFKEYVETIYDKRLSYQQNNSNLAVVMKLLMNSLYGKFGQKSVNKLQLIDMECMTPEMCDAYERAKEVSGDGRIQYIAETLQCTDDHVIPIIPSYTTSRARLLMYDYIIKYRADYMDTDSIITSKEIPTSSRLGDMKKEYFIRKGQIIKPKAYMVKLDEKDLRIGDKTIKIKMKGIPKMTEQMFKDIMMKKSVSYPKFTKMKEALLRGIPPNFIQRMQKFTDLEDTKRVWRYKYNPFVYDTDSRPHKIGVA